MQTNYPTRLERPPLTEAIFEMRFEPAVGQSGELLPGLMFQHLKHVFSRVEPTPVGIIPKEMRLQHSHLRYVGQFRLAGDNDSLYLGDNVATLSRKPVYGNWGSFSGRCLEVATALRTTEYVDTIQRYSLKYNNSFDVANHPLEPFRIQLDIERHSMSADGFALRFETRPDRFRTIVEIKSIVQDSSSKRGTSFTIDTICTNELGDFWERIAEYLGAAHAVVEDHFFGLLKSETIESFGPSSEKTI